MATQLLMYFVMVLLILIPINAQISLSWTTGSNLMPDAIDSAPIGYDGKYIWMIGGDYAGYLAQNTIYKFDPLNETFSKSPLIIQSKIETPGQSYTQLYNTVYFVHNAPASDTHFIHALNMTSYTTSHYTAISILPNEPEFIFGSPCLASYPNTIFVIGGDCGSVCTNKATHILTLDGLTWSLGPNVNEARSLHSCSISNGILYAIGGSGIQKYMSTIEKWDFINDPTAETWNIITSILNPPRKLHRSVAIKDGIIIAGGWTDGPLTLNDIDILHTADAVNNNEYIESLTSMQYLRGNLGFVLADNILYGFSGYSTDPANHGNLLNYEYSDIPSINTITPTMKPISNTITSQPTYMPTLSYPESQELTGLEWSTGSTQMIVELSSMYGGFNAKTDEVWIFGGQDASRTEYNNIWIMDINTNIFNQSKEVIQNAMTSSAQCWTQIDDIIYYINSAPISDNKYLHAINMSNYKTSTTFISTIPNNERGHSLSTAGCMTSFANKLYIIGGEGFFNYYGSYIYDIINNEWSYGAEIIEYRESHSCNIIDGVIYVIGGYGIQDTIASIEKWDFINNANIDSFEGIYPILNPGRYRHRSINIGNGRILITGGWSKHENGDSILLDNVDVLHTRNSISYIESLSPLTQSRGSHLLLQINDYFMVIGGNGGGDIRYYNNWENTNIVPTAMPTNRPTTGKPTIATQYPTKSPSIKGSGVSTDNTQILDTGCACLVLITVLLW
eukprot:79840_1